ncbi:hypothetical protein D3C72_2552270 [compost metagenome]
MVTHQSLVFSSHEDGRQLARTQGLPVAQVLDQRAQHFLARFAAGCRYTFRQLSGEWRMKLVTILR